jgi:hypothetical protein
MVLSDIKQPTFDIMIRPKEDKICVVCSVEFRGVKQSRTCSHFCRTAASVIERLAIKKKEVERMKVLQKLQKLIVEADDLKKAYDNYMSSDDKEEPTS